MRKSEEDESKNILCTAAGTVGSFIASLFGGWDTGNGTLVLLCALIFFQAWPWPGYLRRAPKQKLAP